MKKIAIDLDGVVFDSENLYRVYTEIYDTDVYKKDNIIDNSQRLFQNRYNWDKQESKNFYKENAEKVLKSANLITGADIVLNKIKDIFEIIIVTARDDFEIELAKEKLNMIGLNNIKIFHNEHDKINRFINEKVDYIIDDDDLTCIKAAENNIIALFFKNNASNKIENKNVININNWGEVYKYLILSKDL